VDNFPTRWYNSTLGFKCSSVFRYFFLWGYVKDRVFSTPVPDITNLKARIADSFATITEEMLENTWREIDYRLDVLCATKGARVEVY